MDSPVLNNAEKLRYFCPVIQQAVVCFPVSTPTVDSYDKHQLHIRGLKTPLGPLVQVPLSHTEQQMTEASCAQIHVCVKLMESLWSVTLGGPGVSAICLPHNTLVTLLNKHMQGGQRVW